MKNWIVRLLAGSMLLVSMSAFAQLGGGTLPCASTRTNIESVRYLGKNSGKDSVEVRWRNSGVDGVGSLGGGGFNTTTSPTLFCFNSLASATFVTMKVDVKITRKFGHQDSGSLTISGKFSDPASAIVQIPRGAAETDPQSYEVSLTSIGVSQGSAAMIASFKGQGVPSLQVTPTISVNPAVPTSCQPTIALTQATFVAGSGTVKDRLTIGWTRGAAPTACFQLKDLSVIATVTRSNGTTGFGSVSAPSTATTATLDLTGDPSPIGSFEIKISGRIVLPVTVGRTDLDGQF